ncbi:MAG: PorP/SprF family type IX secretion system membrane protein [Chitinophagales bacterium]|nr:PorP/SprF family type IX secretion system membrane protein [Chitinophagales bacterium]
MRRTKHYTLLLALILVSIASFAQDIHFSQFHSAPLYLNPALAGINGGNYRFVSNYKTQWNGLAPYNTVAASYDMNMFKQQGARGNFGGMGIFFFTDKAGDSELRTTQVNLNLSYTVMVSKKQSITSGIVGGLGYRSINYANLVFDSQYDPTGQNPINTSGESFATDNVLYPELGAGFLWNYVKNEKTNFYFGGSIYHLTQPNLSFMEARDEKLYVKFTAHAGGYFGLNEQIFLLPSILYMNQGPHNQFNFGALVKVRKSIIPSDRTAFYIGGWYRLKDAMILNARVDVGQFNIGFSYDINLSGLTPASNANGGAELSLIYTGFFRSKKNEVKICPPMMGIL